MKRLLIILLLSCIQLSLTGQNTYFTRTGHIYFISETDIINIDANNYQAASFLDIETGKVQVAVLIKSFEFSLATAKEHFNESYMESDKYPKATFKGNLIDFKSIRLEPDKTHQLKVQGDITIRGITKTIDAPVELYFQNEFIIAKSELRLSIDDFNIKVPKVVEHRVAKEIIVQVNMKYSRYKDK